MACEKYRRWISDELDGELNADRAHRLAGHLRQCAACRLYREKLHRLQQEFRQLGVPSPPPGYWEDFSSRLKDRIQPEKALKEKAKPVQRGWRWAWAGAALLLLAGFSVVIFLRPVRVNTKDYFLSFENFLDHVYQEIGNDARLADLFNLALMDSLSGTIEEGSLGAGPGFPEDALFLERLSEKEVEWLNQEIEKETKSLGV